MSVGGAEPTATAKVEDFKGVVDGGGVKNAGRMMGQLPPESLEQLADIYTYGAKKYAPGNWLRGYKWSLSYDALQRHLNAFWRGEDFDVESKLRHLAHAMWHVAALLYWSLYPKQYAQFDDRLFKRHAAD